MKITKAKLKQIIKEELMREYEYDAQSEIYDITQHLSDAAMKLGEFANSLRGSDERKSLQFDSLSRQVKKIQGAVETHVSGVESGLQEGAQKLLKESEAESALQHYAASIGAEEEDLETVAVDLITDVLQLLREKGINADKSERQVMISPRRVPKRQVPRRETTLHYPVGNYDHDVVHL